MITRDLHSNNKTSMRLMSVIDVESNEQYAAFYDTSHIAIPRQGEKINFEKVVTAQTDNPDDVEPQEEAGPFVVEEIIYEYSIMEEESDEQKTDGLLTTVEIRVSKC